MADTSTLQLPWRPAPTRRPSSAKFGHVTRGAHGPGNRSTRRPGSAPLRPSYEPPAPTGVARRERMSASGSTDALGSEAAAVDVVASWPESFVATMSGEPIPTMSSPHSEHTRFLGKSAQRRERLAAIMDAVESEYHERKGLRQVVLTKRQGTEWARTCRHYVHGSHADHGELGKDRGPPPHRRSPGPNTQRPWSASSADRSQSVLNLGLPLSASWDPSSAASHMQNPPTTAADPVMQAIAARRQRSESWGLSKPVESAIAVPTPNGVGWYCISSSDSGDTPRGWEQSLGDVPNGNATEAEWLEWVKRTMELRQAPLVQLEKMYSRVEAVRSERSNAIEAVAKGGRQRRENGNYVGRRESAPMAATASDQSITTSGIRGRFTNQQWGDPVDMAAIAETPTPHQPSRGYELRGMGSQLLFIDRSMAELLLDICEVPSIRQAASMAISAGPLVDTSKLVRASPSRSPSSTAARRSSSSASRQLSTSGAQPTTDGAEARRSVTHSPVSSSRGSVEEEPRDADGETVSEKVVVPRLDLSVLSDNGTPKADARTKAVQKLVSVSDAHPEVNSVHIDQRVQQQIVRDALAHAQAGARSASTSGQSTSIRQKSSVPARRRKGASASVGKPWQQRNELVVSPAAMRSRQQATVARRISQMWGGGRGVPLRATRSLQYA